MGSNILKYKDSTKYLGLILDGSLTWKSHIKELNQKLIKCTGIFSKVCYCLPSTCRKTVYNAFIFSRLNYGSEIYINTIKKYIQPLVVTQNELLRILQFKLITIPLKNIYREFNTLKLKDLNYYNICCIAHKLIHSLTLLLEAINDIFCRNDQLHDHDTRYKKDLHSLKIKTKLYNEKRFLTKGQPSGTTCPSISRKQHQPLFSNQKLKKYILEITKHENKCSPSSDKFLPKICSILSPNRVEPNYKSDTYKSFSNHYCFVAASSVMFINRTSMFPC